MGMYTELIFGAKLKKETPESVIGTLKFMLGEIDLPDKLEFDEGFFNSGSFCFPISKSQSDLFLEDEQWVFSHRGNYKDQDGHGFIEKFLEWILQYIESGSGQNDIYAITIGEDALAPFVFSLE